MAHGLVKHVMKDEYDIYCGRWNPKVPIHSKWHNPFKNGTREENIKSFIEYLINNETLMSEIKELKGKRLACWCAPQDCHCDILAMIANDEIV